MKAFAYFNLFYFRFFTFLYTVTVQYRIKMMNFLIISILAMTLMSHQIQISHGNSIAANNTSGKSFSTILWNIFLFHLRFTIIWHFSVHWNCISLNIIFIRIISIQIQSMRNTELKFQSFNHEFSVSFLISILR